MRSRSLARSQFNSYKRARSHESLRAPFIVFVESASNSPSV